MHWKLTVQSVTISKVLDPIGSDRRLDVGIIVVIKVIQQKCAAKTFTLRWSIFIRRWSRFLFILALLCRSGKGYSSWSWPHSLDWVAFRCTWFSWLASKKLFYVTTLEVFQESCLLSANQYTSSLTRLGTIRRMGCRNLELVGADQYVSKERYGSTLNRWNSL